MSQSVIGIDFSANAKNTWAALADARGDRLCVLALKGGLEDEEIERLINGAPAAVAIDAPFGWPAAFVSFVHSSHYGRPTEPTERRSFRYRKTDEFVRCKTEKVPLSASTDKLGVAAHRAVSLLARLAACDIPPLREHGHFTKVIEVYPAATLAALGLARKYDGSSGSDKITVRATLRRDLLQSLSEYGLDLSEEDVATCVQHADAFDACVCALTGCLYLSGNFWPPPDDEVVRREGWIVFPRERR